MDTGSTERQAKVRAAALLAEKSRRQERLLQATLDGGLLAFIRYFWPVIEPSRPLVEGWPLEAICEHLEAVTSGDIKRLCISIPPGFMKSLTANVFWPAWEWGPMDMASMRYIAASYSQSLTVRDNVRFRNIIMSPQYQYLWSQRFSPSRDQFNIVKVANDKTGWKLATSVGGVGTGERADRFVCDDGNSVKDAESDAVRGSTNQWFTEVVPTRLNDAVNGVIINIQQRTHEEDITGIILSQDMGFDHLSIPMEWDNGRVSIPTSIGWSDPRDTDGELAWPERFPAKAVADLKKVMGPYAVSGQFQQQPEVRGGGIIKREWWKLWDKPQFPECKYVWASADTAYTEKEENDPTGFTVWGLFEDALGNPNVILMHAWRKRLEIHVPKTWTDARKPEVRRAVVKQWRQAELVRHSKIGGQKPVIAEDMEPWASFIATGANNDSRWPNESYDCWVLRTQEKWGLCEWLAHSCKRFGVHLLLIEGKASGLSVAQELRRLHGGEGWGVHVTQPEGDKVSRLYAVQPTFAAGLVYAPEREWSQLVIDEVSVFPKGRFKDLTDATSMALKYIRDIGRLVRAEERMLADEDMARFRPKEQPLYPAG